MYSCKYLCLYKRESSFQMVRQTTTKPKSEKVYLETSSCWMPGAEQGFQISQHFNGEPCASSLLGNWACADFCYMYASRCILKITLKYNLTIALLSMNVSLPLYIFIYICVYKHRLIGICMHTKFIEPSEEVLMVTSTTFWHKIWVWLYLAPVNWFWLIFYLSFTPNYF